MARPTTPQPRSRGAVETLPSGALRIRVYAGIDPVTGKRHYLEETIPASPKAKKDAEKVRTRLLGEVDERRNPKTKATVNQLLDRYLSVIELEDSTRVTYQGYIDNHIRPLLGRLSVGRPGWRDPRLVLCAATYLPRPLPGATSSTGPEVLTNAMSGDARTRAGRSRRPPCTRSTAS